MLKNRISPAWVLLCFLLASSCANDTNFISKESSKSYQKGETPTTASGDALPAAKSERPDGNGVDDEGFRLVREFQTTYTESATIKFMPSDGVVEQTFTLASQYEQAEKSFTQISRPNVTKNFRQGNPGETRTERLYQADQGILDLLIVIDDSGSMKEEQQNLSTKLAPLLEYIKDSDWRIGVVTTDVARGCSRAVLQKGDSGIAKAFANAINAGLSGSGNEQGIRQAVAGLSCPNAMFVRENSTIAVLIVSDEDNCSNGNGCPAPYNSPAYLTNFLENDMKRKLGTDARVYGLFWEPDTVCPGAAIRATQYAKAVSDTSGTAGSICDADYSNTLLKISENVAAILKADFKLKSTPDINSVKVKINGIVKTTGFEIIGDVLRFLELPPKGAVIDVSYTVGAKPYKDRYPLGEAPAPGTATVRLDGNILSEDGYEIDGQTNDLVFKAMPPTSVDIRVDFLKNIPLVKNFDLSATLKPGSLKVKIDGQVTEAFSVSNGSLEMNTVPNDGAVIVATFEKLIGPILEYEIPLVGTEIRDIAATTNGGQLPISIELRDGRLLVDANSHVEGATVTLRYSNSDSHKTEIVLPYKPIVNTIKVGSGQTSCVLGDGFEVIDELLKLDCDVDVSQDLEVTFTYKKDPIKTFLIYELEALSEFNVEVFIDGNPTQEFLINKPVLRVTGDVPLDSMVRVILTSKN